MGRAKVVTVLSQKGGAGKSTLTMQLAGGLVRKGLRVVVIDLDPQETALRWSHAAPEGTPFPATVIQLGTAVDLFTEQWRKDGDGGDCANEHAEGSPVC